MEILNYNKSNKLVVSRFIRVGDLLYFDGPFLTLFEDAATGHLYLFDWVDQDSENNRWLVYRVHPKELFKFMTRKHSLFELFLNRSDEPTYFTDLGQGMHYNVSEVYALTEIPKKYLPSKENYFDVDDSRGIEKIEAKLMNRMSTQNHNEYHYSIEKIKVKSLIEFNDNRTMNSIQIGERRSYYIKGNRRFEINKQENVKISSLSRISSEMNILNKQDSKLSIQTKVRRYANRYH